MIKDMLLYDIFVNALFIISFIFIAASIYKEHGLERDSNLRKKISFGFMGAIMGVFSMILSEKVPNSNTLLDLRQLSLIFIYYVAGVIPAVITGVGIIIYRLGVFGLNQSSIIAVSHVISFIIAYLVIDKYEKGKKKRLILYFITTMIIYMPTVYYTLYNNPHYTMLFDYSLITLITFMIMYYLIGYVESSNDLYRKYKDESKKDYLTGLYNMRQFDLIYNKMTARVINSNEMLSVLLIDIDHFKQVNDQYGHHTGDSVLSQLSDLLNNISRKTDVVSRIGGEEFCILLLNADKEASMIIAERIRKYVENFDFKINKNETIRITVSIGVATYPELTQDIATLKENADSALYESKFSGRNKVSIYQ